METLHPEILPRNQFGFVRLQTLHLNRTQFNYESQQPFDLFSSCSNLRNLCFCDCYLSRFSVFKITKPQLITFSLSNFVLAYPSRIKLPAPVLTSISFRKSLPQNFTLVELPAITNLNFQFYLPHQFLRSIPSNLLATNALTNMFRVLRHARFVTLSCGTFKVYILINYLYLLHTQTDLLCLSHLLQI